MDFWLGVYAGYSIAESAWESVKWMLSSGRSEMRISNKFKSDV